MVTRDTAWPAGTPCWVDLGVDSIDQAVVFYGALFGWDVDRGGEEFGGYSMASIGGRNVAGFGPRQDQDQPPFWTTYVASDDVDETASRIKHAGGQVLVEPMDVMDVGRMAIAADVDGAVFGVWQARAHVGAQLANEPGAYSWNENMSRNFEGNRKFYTDVFGYSYEDLSNADFQYATASLPGGGNPVGGIGGLSAETPAEVPAAWTTYFAVTDTDASVQKVEALGGKVLVPAQDTPFGRMAVVTDDQGAAFAVIDLSTAAGG
jgi:predicted enzyme related to lactoylglutathione lyase